MGAGLAALAGLGRGSGGLLEGMITGDKLALEQEQLAAQRQYQQGHLDILRQQLGQPFAIEAMRAAKAQQMVQDLTKAAQPQPVMTPGTTLGMPAGPLDLKPPPAGPMPPLSRPEGPQAALLRMIPILGGAKPEAAADLLVSMAKPKPPTVLKEGDIGILPEGGEPQYFPPRPTPPPPQAPPGTILTEYKHGPYTFRVPAEDKDFYVMAEQAIADAKADPGNPEKQAKAQVFAAAKADRLTHAGAGAPKITNEFKPPAPEQTLRGSNLGDAVSELRRLADVADARPPAGPLTHQRERWGGKLENITGVPVLSEAEAAYQAEVAAARSALNNALATTALGRDPELRQEIREALGDPTVPNAGARMRALASSMERRLRTFQTTVASGERIPPDPGQMPPPGRTPSEQLPTAGKFIEGLFNPKGPLVQNPALLNREVLSRRSPSYQKAIASGLTEAQIQQKYGVQVVP